MTRFAQLARRASLLALYTVFVVTLSIQAQRIDWARLIPAPPPPDPSPVDPTVPVNPVDVAVDGPRLLIVEEFDQRGRLPASQIDIFVSAAVREAIESRGGQLRILDQNTPAEGAPEWFRAALALPRQSLPWLVWSDGRTGYSGPLPATEAELLKRIGK